MHAHVSIPNTEGRSACFARHGRLGAPPSRRDGRQPPCRSGTEGCGTVEDGASVPPGWTPASVPDGAYGGRQGWRRPILSIPRAGAASVPAQACRRSAGGMVAVGWSAQLLGPYPASIPIEAYGGRYGSASVPAETYRVRYGHITRVGARVPF